MRKVLIESFVIDTDSSEKCSNSDDKSYTCKCEWIEKLIRKCLICRIYIPASSKIEYHLNNQCNPKNLSMDTIDQNKDKNIYQRNVEHAQIIEK